MKISSKKCCSFFLALILSAGVCASGLPVAKGKLLFESPARDFSEGDIFNAKLLIQASEGLDPQTFRSYVGRKILGHFFVIEFIRAGILKEDPLAIEVVLKLALIKSMEQNTSVPLKHEGFNINVDINGEKFKKYPGPADKFMLLNQKTKKGYFWHYLVGLLGAILFIFASVVIAKYVSRTRKKRKREKEERDRRKHFVSFVKGIDTKEDLQKVYSWKKEMRVVFKEEKSFNEVVQVINEHQYKNVVPKELIEDLRKKLEGALDDGI